MALFIDLFGLASELKTAVDARQFSVASEIYGRVACSHSSLPPVPTKHDVGVWMLVQRCVQERAERMRLAAEQEELLRCSRWRLQTLASY